MKLLVPERIMNKKPTKKMKIKLITPLFLVMKGIGFLLKENLEKKIIILQVILI